MFHLLCVSIHDLDGFQDDLLLGSSPFDPEGLAEDSQSPIADGDLDLVPSVRSGGVGGIDVNVGDISVQATRAGDGIERLRQEGLSDRDPVADGILFANVAGKGPQILRLPNNMDGVVGRLDDLVLDRAEDPEDLERARSDHGLLRNLEDAALVRNVRVQNLDLDAIRPFRRVLRDYPIIAALVLGGGSDRLDDRFSWIQQSDADGPAERRGRVPNDAKGPPP